MKFIKRRLGGATLHYRRPLTLDLLASLIKSVNLTDYDTRVMITMIVVGTFGLFRIGEICYVKRKRDVKFIRNCDAREKDQFKIILYGTKTDTEKKGITIYCKHP